MQELIKYIGDILNIKTDSVYTIQDMTEELSKIKDIVAYRSYIKDNFYKEEFKSGYQKFLVLTSNYKELETHALRKIEYDDAVELAISENIDFIKENEGFEFNTDHNSSSALNEIGTKIQNILGKYNLQMGILMAKYSLLHNGIGYVKMLETFKEASIKHKFAIEKKPYEELPERLKEMTKKKRKLNAN